MALGDVNNPMVMTAAPSGTAVRRTTEGQISSGPGRLVRIVISPTVTAPTAGLLTFYDSATEAGTQLFSTFIRAADTVQVIDLNINYATALFMGFDGTLANIAVTAVVDD